MLNSKHSVYCVLYVAGTLLIAGCGKQTPPTGMVIGTVSLDGKPLTNGTVLFIPDLSGQYASGTIGKNGSFHLTTFREGDGALLGTHKIIVTAVRDVVNEGDPVVPLTPTRYSSEKTSGLEATIQAGENHVNLELSSAMEKKGQK